MFERIGPLEPWIKHPVRKDEVRRARVVQGAPRAETAVLPNSVDHHSVILFTPLGDPVSESGRVTVTADPGAGGMDRNGKILQPRVGRRVERNNFHFVSTTKEGNGRLPNGFNRTADRRVKGVNGPKYLHPDGAKGLSLPDETFLATEILHLLRKLLQRFGRDAGIELIRNVPFLVQKRFRTEH